jgi:monothiol glutaredoxin
MGIVDKIKRSLPIVGGGEAPRTMSPREEGGRPAPRAEAVAPAKPAGSVHDFIDGMVKSNKLFLFMKGSPSAPQCGFSANAAGILQSYGVREIPHFDVLSDPDVRQGIKEYSDWPTIPQLYIGGEFVGGSDILTELHQSGELRGLLQKAGAIA